MLGGGVAHPTPAVWAETFGWCKILKFTDLSQESDSLKIGSFLIYRKQTVHLAVKMGIHRKEKPFEIRNPT
jgi:hypothetical protein